MLLVKSRKDLGLDLGMGLDLGLGLDLGMDLGMELDLRLNDLFVLLKNFTHETTLFIICPMFLCLCTSTNYIDRANGHSDSLVPRSFTKSLRVMNRVHFVSSRLALIKTEALAKEKKEYLLLQLFTQNLIV